MNDTRPAVRLRGLLFRRVAVFPFSIPTNRAIASIVGPAMAAACLIAFAARGMSQEPLLLEEIPAPVAVVEGLQNDIKRLEKEIEALRTDRAPPDSENLTLQPT